LDEVDDTLILKTGHAARYRRSSPRLIEASDGRCRLDGARDVDPTYADAILDRLVHNAHRIELAGESLRRTRGKQNQKA
jgi:DNA replication protein DnaC